jgi:uncharacterized lipoprotein YmbA
MKKLFSTLFALALVAVIAAGCASSPSRFYTLNDTAKGDGVAEMQYAVLVGPVTIPAEVDRPQFTIQIAPNCVAIDEFNRWAEPLNENIARVVAADLATLLGSPRVTAVSLANFDPAYRVTIDIQRFQSKPGNSAQLEAVWVVHKVASTVTLSGHTIANEPVSGNGFEALAAAHSRALAKMSTDIAAAVRTEAETKP